MTIGNWHLNLNPNRITMDSFFKEKSGDFLKNWIKVFPAENSWVNREVGVPSLIVRLDCVNNDHLKVFEVEERPAGIGISSRISESFAMKLKEIRKTWPEFKSLVSKKRMTHDDDLWLESKTFEEASSNDDLLLIRAEPEEEIYHQFQNRSVSTLINKGDKSYGLKMNLWKEVGTENFFQLPWEQGFCLKPQQSSKCRGVEIFHPVNGKMKNNTKIRGASTKTRIQKILTQYGKMYLQPLIEPDNCPFLIGNKIVLRVFFGYNIEKAEYQFLGGVWNSRPNLKIHGASDTIMGVVD